MLFGLYEQDIVAIILLGLIANFLFSFLFGLYLTQNIGMEEMLALRGKRRQSPIAAASLFIPYAKMLLTLYRVAILQLYFLNRGHTPKEFWVYMTRDDEGDKA